MVEQSKGALSGRWALPFLGVSCAVGVASLYYNQPLLSVIGSSLGADARQVGFVAERRRLDMRPGCCFLCRWETSLNAAP